MHRGLPTAQYARLIDAYLCFASIFGATVASSCGAVTLQRVCAILTVYLTWSSICVHLCSRLSAFWPSVNRVRVHIHVRRAATTLAGNVHPCEVLLASRYAGWSNFTVLQVVVYAVPLQTTEVSSVRMYPVGFLLHLAVNSNASTY